MNGRGRAARPLRVLFFLLHPGYLRYFAPTIEELAARGHDVRLAFAQASRTEADERLVTATTSHALIERASAPERERTLWRPIATLVRYLVDIARFGDATFDDAPALRARPVAELDALLARARVPRLPRRAVAALLGSLSSSGNGVSRLAVRTLLRVERAIPTSRAMDAFVASSRPDVVLVTPVVEFGSPQVDAVKSAVQLGVPSGIAVASWDNLTTKGHLRSTPDAVFVWNETQRDEAVRLHGIAAERVRITGAPKFDQWFARVPSPRSRFAREAGIDPGSPFVLYLCSSRFIAPDELSFVREWIGWLRSDPALAHLIVVVRPHPQNAEQWQGAVVPEGVVIHPAGGSQPDGEAGRSTFFDSLNHAAAVVGINTSGLIEAAITGKAVLSVADPRHAPTQQGTLHFRYLLAENGGFVWHAPGRAEHLDQLRDVLRGTEAGAKRARAFLEAFVRPHGLDRPAAPILADEIERLARFGDQPRRTRARSRRPNPLRVAR